MTEQTNDRSGSGDIAPGGAAEPSSSTDWSWTTPRSDEPPVEIDTTRPSIARVYDAAIGGKDHYEVDAKVIEEGRRVSPAAVDSARVNRDLLIRGVRYLAEQGIDQYLDLGSGLPSAQNTHQVAQAIIPHARVVYVDNDPIVLSHGRALLAKNNNTRVLTANILDADEILNSPEVEGFLDFSRPVGLLMMAVVHHLLDEEDPVGVVERYKSQLVSGSYLFLTHFCNTFPEAKAMEDVLVKSLGRGQLRSREAITGLFDGMEILEPGVVPLPLWRPDEPVAEPLDHSGLMMVGGMAVKR
ncbi:SAM-dependent methyltransferase [Streptomyces sp. 3MP-14]|uniref:SAM-dependent methyltransferase n=1 Tax=Streptomyces mimosae TaxID=2586635 RepID=A0A5N6A644_9ACTN|nr:MULTISPECIES: SAM-dependent methyltransferase [Streptomyces]KAB8164274.1 SAM-dependent methyltransferase [Streptomyces mimosae]KAB8176551.1 SAM-dependent methyltransferase [Streptomyces sp. 3MP-14]